jgi:hypothetical protein
LGDAKSRSGFGEIQRFTYG